MTEQVVKIKLAILATLILQTAGLAFFFGSFKTGVEKDVLALQDSLREVRGELVQLRLSLMQVNK